MTDSLRSRCETFIKARDIIKENFKMESNFIYPVCAMLFVNNGTVPTAEKLNECKALINKKTDFFSNFRGTVKLPLICMLAASNSPSEKLSSTLELYDKLKKEFPGSQHLALTAATMADIVKPDSAATYIERGKAIYRSMGKEHPFITSDEDKIFAVLLAFSDKTDDELIAEMEKAFGILKKELNTDSNSTQTLSHIIALTDGDTKDKCDKVISLYNKIKEKGMKYSRYFEMAVLASAAMLPVDLDSLADEIAEADGFLSKQQGYTGLMGLDKKTRAMHAVMLTAGEHAESAARTVPDSGMTAAFTGTMYTIAAQQAMMCAIVATSAASVASASSHN